MHSLARLGESICRLRYSLRYQAAIGSVRALHRWLSLSFFDMVYRPNLDEQLCFVLMPFRDPFNEYYEKIIKPAVSAANLKAVRADEIYGTQPIISDIWRHIWRARVVIADVTGKNPNVNYELGLCHALGVATLLLTQSMEDVPFDYRHRRCILYQPVKARWADELNNQIVNTIRAVLAQVGDEGELKWPYDAVAAPKEDKRRFTAIDNPQDRMSRGLAEVGKLVSKAYGPLGVDISIKQGGRVVSHRQGLVIAQGVQSPMPSRKTASNTQGRWHAP